METLNRDAVILIRLRSPYGVSGENVGEWCRDHENWHVLVSGVERERLGLSRLIDGEFYISFDDFVQTFTHIECVHVDTETSRDEPTLQGKGNLIFHDRNLQCCAFIVD